MTEQTHSRLRALSDADHFPALSPEYLHAQPAFGLGPLDPAPRILLLYGSLRERSYSRLVVEETARLLQLFGCETGIFEIGRASCRERVCQSVSIAVGALSLKKK